MPKHEPWVFPARLVRVIDGDTCVLELDLGLSIRTVQRFRLADINTPEMVGAERVAALAARDGAAAWFSTNGNPDVEFPFLAKTLRTDDYGRWLAQVYRVDKPSGESLGDYLLRTGLAAPFMTGKSGV